MGHTGTESNLYACRHQVMVVEARIPYIYTWGVPKVRVLSTLPSCSRGATGRHIGFKHRTSDGFDSLREYQKKYCGIVQFGRTLDVNQGVDGSITSPTAKSKGESSSIG